MARPNRDHRTPHSAIPWMVAAVTAMACGGLSLGATTARASATNSTTAGITRPTTFISTPLHPEKIAHPGDDFMGSTIAAHEPHGTAIKPLTRQQALAKASTASGTQVTGIDVSSIQGAIDWSTISSSELDFVYAKATEGSTYTNPDFTNQSEGPASDGIVHGAYHFAWPNDASGQAQADYFIAHGGAVADDGMTMPGMLDIEYDPDPNSDPCYGLTQTQMVDWIWDFVNEYYQQESVYPVIYSTTDWWTRCTGNYAGFAPDDPLDIANYNSSPGTLPAGWTTYTFWQYADSGTLPGDQDLFNGSYQQLQSVASQTPWSWRSRPTPSNDATWYQHATGSGAGPLATERRATPIR